MSSYLEKQQRAFKGNVTSAASKVSSAKRPNGLVPKPEAAPSPAPSNASNTSKSEKENNKRKRDAALAASNANTVYSQPMKTGYGTEAFTQVTYVIEFLKLKDEPKTFKEILEYLSQVHAQEDSKRLIAQILKRHDRVTWRPDPELKVQTWDSGTFVHRPLINVRTKDQLIQFLQAKVDAQGVLVKEIKDGWPDCEDAINELEAEHKILVTRTKKDNHARMVWSNDPTLIHKVDDKFQEMWNKIELPSVDDVVRKLMESGQKPASEDPSKRIKAAAKPKEKKKKAPRKGGKVTNSHMQHLLVDYNGKFSR
jgi:transcription initiation factor TFIIE subunit beta